MGERVVGWDGLVGLNKGGGYSVGGGGDFVFQSLDYEWLFKNIEGTVDILEALRNKLS